jgi:integrase
MPRSRGMGRVYQRGEVWWVEYWHKGIQYRESTGLRGARQKGAAERLLRVKTGEIAQGVFQPGTNITINQILDDFEKDYRLRGGRQYGKLCSHLKPVRVALGHLKAQDLTERRIDDYIEHRLKKVAPSTINRETQPLGQALRLAYTRQLIKRVPTIRGLKETNIRQGFYEYEEVVAIVEHLPDYLQDFVWFGYYCGWRKGEIAQLEWRDVDMRSRIIRLRPEVSKTADGRSLPLEGPLWDLFKRRWEGRDIQWVFHRNHRPIGDFRKAWLSACRKAGITRLFHDFRRSAARDMIEAGVPEKTVMEIIGHKTRSMLDRYNIVSETQKRDAVRKTHLFRTSRTEPA